MTLHLRILTVTSDPEYDVAWAIDDLGALWRYCIGTSSERVWRRVELPYMTFDSEVGQDQKPVKQHQQHPMTKRLAGLVRSIRKAFGVDTP